MKYNILYNTYALHQVHHMDPVGVVPDVSLCVRKEFSWLAQIKSKRQIKETKQNLSHKSQHVIL